jgi:hypothetical protein
VSTCIISNLEELWESIQHTRKIGKDDVLCKNRMRERDPVSALVMLQD